MHQALYRKYRPATFDDVIGQEHITSVLSWEVANHKVSHAYLFCGSAGTGKTSCAKILAKAVNCEHPSNGNPCNQCPSCLAIDSGASVEVLEMDAASNTGVDYIREIREEVIFTPSAVGTKVYIIDEVHMLSEGAFNALLKTLEEPPQNVIFVLATTELQDIPATILSRCQRFDFKRLTSADILQRLNYIATQESLILEESAGLLIARLAQGGMRDAVSLFELCIDRDGRVTEEGVRAAAGIVGRETVVETLDAIRAGDTEKILSIISDIFRSSKDLSVFMTDLIALYRDMLVYKIMRFPSVSALNRDILDVSEQEFSDIKRLSDAFTREKIVYHISLLENAYIRMNKSDVKRITAELTLVRMALGKTDSSLEGLEARIAALEVRAPLKTLPSSALASQAEPLPQEGTPSPAPTALSDEPKPVSKEEKEPARLLADWVDIKEDFAKQNPSAAAFLGSSTATYVKAACEVTVYLESSFSMIMLDRPEIKEALSLLLAQYGITAKTLNFRVSPKDASPQDPLRDFA